MTTVDLAEKLTNEHHEIDAGIEEFVGGLGQGRVKREPLHRAFAALRRHIYLEEELLFPAVRRAGLLMPVLVMIREHGQVWRLMDELEEMLAGAAPDLGKVRATCEQLLAELDSHNMKEEPVIYPHTATDLDEQETATLADFIATGATPPGWLCEAVR